MKHLAPTDDNELAHFEGQFPVLLRLECHDLIVPLYTEPQSGRLTWPVWYHTVVQACVLGLCVCVCGGGWCVCGGGGGWCHQHVLNGGYLNSKSQFYTNLHLWYHADRDIMLIVISCWSWCSPGKLWFGTLWMHSRPSGPVPYVHPLSVLGPS